MTQALAVDAFEDSRIPLHDRVTQEPMAL